MKGFFDAKKSWEKQSFYNLENGFTVRLETSFYGEMVAAVEKGNEIIWHCSNGTPPPDFMKDWRSTEGPEFTRAYLPKFDKVYGKIFQYVIPSSQ